MNSRVMSIAALVFLPAALFAQDSSSKINPTPFRRGQWAAQFQMGFSTISLGFVKFRSPTRALVVDLRLSGSHTERLSTDSTGTHFDDLSSNAMTQLRFGWRRYRTGEAKLASHYTLGLLAGFDHHASRSTVGSFDQNGWTAGVFGDVGGTYLVTPQLGLGALANVSLSYSNSVSASHPGNDKSRVWQIGGSGIIATFVATLFF